MTMECRIERKIDESETGYYIVTKIINIRVNEEYLAEDGKPEVERACLAQFVTSCPYSLFVRNLSHGVNAKKLAKNWYRRRAGILRARRLCVLDTPWNGPYLTCYNRRISLRIFYFLSEGDACGSGDASTVHFVCRDVVSMRLIHYSNKGIFSRNPYKSSFAITL